MLQAITWANADPAYVDSTPKWVSENIFQWKSMRLNGENDI